MKYEENKGYLGIENDDNMRYNITSFSIIIYCCQGGKFGPYDVELSPLLVSFFFFSSHVRQQFFTLRNDKNGCEREREQDHTISFSR